LDVRAKESTLLSHTPSQFIPAYLHASSLHP
jgi:hypothetical protein